MRLPKGVYDAVNNRKIEVFYADREMARFWNERRLSGELRFYAGWYWYVEEHGRAVSNEHGPYHSRSAAYRSAFVENGLRRAEQGTTQVTGSNVVRFSQAGSGAAQRADRNARKQLTQADRDRRALERRLRSMGVA